MKIRGSGILLHITSLPSRFGTGDLGPAAYAFADYLSRSGQRYWQILPLNPTDPLHDDNPYHSISAFAANPLMVSPELMVRDGYLEESDIDNTELFSEDVLDTALVIPSRERLFSRAFDRFTKTGDRRAYNQFCSGSAWWLEDFALFLAIRKDRDGELWNRWPDGLKRRDGEALARERERLHESMERIRFLQFLFSTQWQELRRYCHSRGIRIIGDLPIYVDYDSADVWRYPELFKLDGDMNPTVVAGVPPDYFSASGQLWHNPVYRWEAIEKDHFSWWVRRMERNLALVDYVRIDHFRGLVACWEVPAGAETAMGGQWVEAPCSGLMKEFAQQFPCLPVIAEDLGVITPDVREVMHRFGIPGMKVLLFAFEEGFPENDYLPHHAVRDCILYTGTHDNNPVRGWIQNDATDIHRLRMREYFGREVPDDDLNWELIRMAMATVADTVIFPLQDILGLGSSSRMNRPGIDEGNWKWRVHAYPGNIGEAAGHDCRVRARLKIR